MTAKRIYCFDTSAFLEGTDLRPYPIAHFPALWTKLDELVARKRLISAEEVREEIEKKSDAVAEWVRDRDHLFVKPDGRLESALRKIMNEHSGLVDERRGRGGADPWVIALARVINGVVVSQEGRARKVTIPKVCDAYDLECVTLTQLIQDERWVF